MNEQPDNTTRAFYDSLQGSQWMPASELMAYQRQQLAHLLRHAARTSPFYKDSLSPVLRPDDRIDWDRWQEIPILTRADLQTYRQELLSREVPPHHGYTYTTSTSGTTGEPVTMSWTDLTTTARKAVMWRMYEWHGFDYAGDFAMTFGSDPWPEGKVHGKWGPPWHPHRGALVKLAATTPYPRMAEWLGRRRPKYLGSSPVVMLALIEEMAKQKIENSIACMLAVGGQATPLCRKIVRQALGIPVLEIYSAEECSHVAHECPAGSLHVLSELVHVEIVDEAGQACAPGTEGRVLVTVLHNTAQPTIRYEIGDTGAFAPPCSCGRSLPVLAPISGRTKHMLRFEGQPAVIPDHRAAFRIFEAPLDPTWYQVAQTGPMAVEVRFVSKRRPNEQDFQVIREKLPSIWRHITPDITFKQLDVMPTQPGRKHIVFVNEWEPEITPRLQA